MQTMEILETLISSKAKSSQFSNHLISDME